MSDLNAKLDELEELLERATPGEWEESSGYVFVSNGTFRLKRLGWLSEEDDARLIVAAVNALPAFIAVAREADRQPTDYWEAALDGPLAPLEKALDDLEDALEQRRS